MERDRNFSIWFRGRRYHFNNIFRRSFNHISCDNIKCNKSSIIGRRNIIRLSKCSSFHVLFLICVKLTCIYYDISLPVGSSLYELTAGFIYMVFIGFMLFKRFYETIFLVSNITKIFFSLYAAILQTKRMSFNFFPSGIWSGKPACRKRRYPGLPVMLAVRIIQNWSNGWSNITFSRRLLLW